MDDGERRRTGGSLILLIYFFLTTTKALDTEIEYMRSEGFGKHDISLFVEERVEFIHSRIQLQPLLTSIDYGRKASNEFSLKVNSSLGKILSMRLNRMATQMDKKLRQLHNPRTRRSFCIPILIKIDMLLTNKMKF